MKKLMIILLIGILTLGLSGVVYAVEQTATVTITTSVGITVDPTALTGSNVATNATWTDVLKTITISANCPYDVKVKFSSAAEPATETTADAYMTAIDADSVEWNLDSAFTLGYYSSGSPATSYDGTPMASATAITSSDVVFLSCPVEPLGGDDVLGIEYKQPIAQYTDIAYTASGAQLSYSIKLTWTVSADV